MKANFNIAKNVRNSRSINALSALRKLQSLGLLLCALLFGSLQVWGATYNSVGTTLTSGKSYIIVAGGQYAITASNPSSGYIGETDVKSSISGSVLTTTNTDIVWEATVNASGKWTFKNGTKYINNNSGSTYRNMSYGTGGSTTYTINTSNSRIYSTGATDKWLQRLSVGNFRMYNSTQSGAKETFVFYELAEACSNNVSVSSGSNTQVSSMTFSSASVATCSSTASDRQVTITLTPNTGYTAPTNLTLGGTVTPSKVSGPTGSGPYTYVYQFAQNANGTTTFAATCTGKQCTVTFDKNGGSDGTNSVTATYGSAMTTITPPTREHYDFEGYYDGAGGTGNKYYNANGTSAATWNKNTTSNTTLYAKWTEHSLTNYRTLCSVTCDDKYCINSYKDGGNGMTCFTDQGSNVWTISNYAIPATGQTDRKDQNDFWVGYDGAWVGGKSDNWHFRWIPFKNLACGTYKLGAAAQAVGTLTINAATSNSNTNYDLTFDPNGYGFCYGTDPSWQTPLAFTRQGVTNIWNTSIVNVSDVISHNYYVGLSKLGGGYVFSSDYDYNDDDEHIDGISEIQTISGMGVASDVTANPVTFRVGGLSSSDGASGMRGYFQIWTDNCNRNFYCHFVPVYTITYKSYDGSSTLYTDQVSAGESFTVRAAETGAIGWAESASQSAASGNYVVGNSYVPTGNVTLYVAMTAYTVSYTATSGTIQRDAVTISSDVVLSGNSVTLPTVTGCSLPCAKFLGWYAGNYSSSSKPAILAAGSSYEPTGDVTLKALYAIVGDNYELVTSASSLVAGSQVVFAYRGWDDDFDAYYPVAMSETQQTDYRDVYDWQDSKVSLNAAGTIISWIEATPDVAEFTVEAGSSNGTYAFKDESGYIYCASTSSTGYLRTQATKDANASWTISISSGEAEMVSGSSQTRKYLWYNSSNDRFSCYASNYAGKKTSIFQRSVSSYTTSPACTTYSVSTCSPGPSNGTISVSAASVSPGGNVTVTFTPSANYMLSAVTVTSGTASVGDPSYSSGPTSAGTVSITNTQSDITVCATFVAIPLYTVTFVDMDNSDATQTRTQASYGANVTAPSTSSSSPHDPCDATWSFVGWAPSNTLSGGTTEPTGFIAAGGTISGGILDDNVTYYSVYTNSSDGTTAFSPGKSGTYYFKAITTTPTTLYATGEINASGRYPTNQATKVPFLITYNSVTTKYTIKNTLTDKYVAPENDNGNNLVERNTSFEFGLETPVLSGPSKNAETGEWFFTYINSSSNKRLIYCNGTYFYSLGDGNDNYYAIYLEPASSIYYYNLSSCTDLVTMTFHPLAGGDPTWADGHPKGEYTDVAKGTISVFPTDEQDGWTFLGWTAGQSYNDNREDAGETMDDDNASSTAPSQTIYSTGGNSYNLQADIDMYPVFTKFADNEPFDQINGGDYYIYYIADNDISPSTDAYGANNRIYAGSYSSSAYSGTASCNDAALFTFTKLPNGKWTIYDNKNNGGTVGNPKHYLCGEQSGSGNDLTLQATATAANYGEWTITLVSGNQFTATCFDSYVLQAQTTNATSGTFKNYASSNYSSDAAHYHRVYLGTCTERLYSSDPTNTPHVNLNGEVAPITSSQNGAIRAASVLSVSGTKLTPSTGTITISSNNGDVYFSTSASASFALADANQPKTSITVTANGSGRVVPTAVYVHYKPSSNTDTWTSVTVTASYPGAVSQTATVDLRIVKENFVIAAKVAGSWYALPANMGSAGVYEPVLIEVDESSKVAYGPSTVGYKMWPVQTVNGGTDEYAANGHKVRFAGNSNKGLWTSSSNNNIQNNATITAIGSTAESPATYEWTLTTADRETYTMYNENGSHYLDLYRPTSGSNAGKLVWAGNGTYETNEVHFFPLTERATINIIPREWKSNGLVFAIDADNNISLTAGHTTAKIGTGDAASATLTRHSTGGYGLYEVALPALASHYGKVLTLKMKIGGVDTYAYTTIPIIVTGTTTTTTAETPFTALGTASKDYDVVILDGAKLTTNATASGAHEFQNFYVYSGGTWVNDNGSTSLKYLELRGGIKGIAAKDSHVQGVPHVMLNKAVSSTAGANLDMTVYTDHGYALSVPFDVALSTVNFANSLKPGTGAQVNGTLASQFWIRKYDGEVRANNGKGGWVDLEPEEVDEVMVYPTIHAGEGYTLQGKRPKGQPFAVIRFPFTGVSSWANASGEVEKGAIPIYAYAGSGTTPDNDKGWNLIANPYMATIAYNTEDELSWAASFKVGSLTETEGAQWDGKYQWENADHAYVTIPNDSYTAFPQTRASKATFYPFKNFFIQTTDAGAVTFVRSDRHEMPRYLMPQEEHTTPIYADINLAHGEESAQAGLTIDANATAGYKFGEDQNIFENREALDYLKMYTISDGHYLVGNTLTPEETAELIPLEFYAPSAEGEYVFSLDEGSDIDRLEYVILYDAALNINTNLLTDDYHVVLAESGLIENRFSIGLSIREQGNTPTDVENIGGENADRPLKFIYHDKMYILRNGVLYDATGKKVREINK